MKVTYPKHNKYAAVLADLTPLDRERVMAVLDALQRAGSGSYEDMVELCCALKRLLHDSEVIMRWKRLSNRHPVNKLSPNERNALRRSACQGYDFAYDYVTSGYHWPAVVRVAAKWWLGPCPNERVSEDNVLSELDRLVRHYPRLDEMARNMWRHPKLANANASFKIAESRYNRWNLWQRGGAALAMLCFMYKKYETYLPEDEEKVSWLSMKRAILTGRFMHDIGRLIASALDHQSPIEIRIK